MTAALASVGPIGWCAIAAGSWLILSVGLGRGIGRAIVCADKAMAHDTQPAMYPPPVPPLPHHMDDAGWDEWVAVWPADTPLEVMEQSVFDRLFADIPEVAADLRRAA